MVKLNNERNKCVAFKSHVYGLLTKRDVKMAGYWLSSPFLCIFIDRAEAQVHAKHAKKNEANIQLSSPNIKGLSYAKSTIFLQNTAGDPERVR